MTEANLLLEHAPSALALLDGRGTIVRTNHAWRSLMGTNAEGFVWYEAVAGLDPAECLAAWSTLTAENRSQTVTATDASTDASECGHARSLKITLNPAEGVGGICAIANVVDVTALRLEEARARAVMDTAVDGIITIDRNGIIETFNTGAVRLFGYSPAEIIGRSISLLMPEPHSSQHDGYVQHYLTTGTAKIIGIGRELEAKRKDGSRLAIHLAVSEFSVGGDRRFAGVVRDISDQHMAREQRERLAHAGRLSIMGEMTAGIAHEINQPLTAIAMYAQSAQKMVERGAADQDRLTSALDKLTTQTLRAGAVIERIQRFVRDQEGHKEAADINDIIVDLMGLARTDARLHDIRIELELAEGIPSMYCDPVQIQQVGLNLIRNAIDAMTEIDCANGRDITISTDLSDAGEVQIAVVDCGPGVDPGDEQHIFKPFHTTKADGMGMGLSISRSIIRNQGGELTYRNNDRFGATFFFTIPIEPMHD